MCHQIYVQVEHVGWKDFFDRLRRDGEVIKIIAVSNTFIKWG